MQQSNIRNFCIIAHIDHGKSTLADRMLELTGTVAPEKLQPQMLDRNPIERERGITIKLQPVRMEYRFENLKYILNLIDTPGHVDFSYEVSRSLAAVEGAILLVDAAQGIQAQTLSNLLQAQKLRLKIIPVVNKIDLAHAEPERVALDLQKLLDCKAEEIIFASGKSGEGVEEILERVVNEIPPPSGKSTGPARCLIFDSVYDRYRGVVVFVRVVDGAISTHEQIKLLGSQTDDSALEVGIFNPEQLAINRLTTGEIGYIVTGLKDIRKVRVGDTITENSKFKIQNSKIKEVEPLPGYRQPTPMVYASIFPRSANDYPLLRDSIGKYILTDASLVAKPENSPIFGFGYQLGFLGLLHVEIVCERLRREYNLDLIVTTPQVEYQIVTTKGEAVIVHSISELPPQNQIKAIREPWAQLEIVTPVEHLGKLIELCQAHRSDPVSQRYLDDQTVTLETQIPLAEIITYFYDRLESASSGYATMAYQLTGYRAGDLVKLDILIADKPFPALAALVPSVKVEPTARERVAKLKNILPRQQFEVKIQAAVGGRIIASERIAPLRKDVTAKLYGGDVTRKNKLLEAQKKGKKRLQRFGNVDLPADLFVKMI